MIDAIRHRLREAFLDALPASRVIRRGPRDVRRVALTFDDGPQPLTAEYLDVLDRLDVPATFFLMGDLTARQPGIVREYLRRGHQVASHGWNHLRFPSLSPAELRAQLQKTDAVLGPQPTGRPWVRPPYGAVTPRVIAQLLASGYTIALWSFETRDFEASTADELADRCAPERLAPGEVLVFHEGQRWTVEALPAIVGRLRDAGYECVTMADLFAA